MIKTLLLISAWILASANAFAVTKISKIEFLGKSEPNQIIVSGDGPLEFEKIENSADNQVILEFKNAKFASTNASRRLDTSSFNSKVSLISPYSVDGQDLVRVIVQFRNSATTEAIAQGNKLFIGIDGAPDTAVMQTALLTDVPTPDHSDLKESGKSIDSKKPEEEKTQLLASTSEKRIEQLTQAVETQKYVGKKITLQFKDADVTDVFKLIGETSGFNVVLGPEVGGKINLSLVDVPWDLALDTVLSTLKLGAERRGNVLRVSSLSALTQEKQQLLAAKTATEASAPRITRIFPISYATPSALIPFLSRFGAGSAGSGSGAGRDTILVDERTNSIVIQDIPENIERMAKIIELLDKPTPQILIEAKIVEAGESFTKSIAGSFGIGAVETISPGKGTGGGYAGASIQGGGLTDPSTSTSLLTGLPSSTAGVDTFGSGFRIGALSNLRFNTLLAITESESKSRIVSSPRTVVLNKQAASIVQGTPVLVPTTSTVSGVGTVVSDTVQSANLSLNVTPTVTNDGNVIMDLNVSSDTPVPLGTSSGIANRSIKSRVVSESGSTIVIGGVYTERDARGEGGIPFLRKIPIIGALFGSDARTNSRTELFIFVTPRVLNEKESGGAG